MKSLIKKQKTTNPGFLPVILANGTMAGTLESAWTPPSPSLPALYLPPLIQLPVRSVLGFSNPAPLLAPHCPEVSLMDFCLAFKLIEHPFPAEFHEN